jgi:hypothetical protein
MLRKMTMVAGMAAALTAVLTTNGYAFSGGVPHVVTHPITSRSGVTAMSINTGTAIRLRNESIHTGHHGAR